MWMVGKHKQLPIARATDLLTEEIDGELVVFDSESKQAHCLTPLASLVFSHCDGQTSADQLVRIASERLGEPVSEDDVLNALAQLEEHGLLASSAGLGISRRDMLHRGAKFGMAAATATLIFTVEPQVAQAATCASQVCSGSVPCPGGRIDCAPSHQCTVCTANRCSCNP